MMIFLASDLVVRRKARCDWHLATSLTVVTLSQCSTVMCQRSAVMRYHFIDTYWCRWWWHSFENDDAADEENFRWLVNVLDNCSRWYWRYCPPDATDDADLSRLMLMKNTLLVKGERWNNVTAKSILIIIGLNPHCGLIMSLLLLD